MQLLRPVSLSASVFTEFVDPKNGGPVETGWAVLVLTELFPYVTHDPLIRYWTDDLVWVERAECACGGDGFTPKGRLGSTLRADNSSIILPRLDLIEAVEHCAGIEWQQSASWIRERYGSVPLERPLAEAELRRSGADLTVVITAKCQFSPQIYKQAAARLAEELRANLLARSRALASAYRDGLKVQVELR